MKAEGEREGEFIPESEGFLEFPAMQTMYKHALTDGWKTGQRQRWTEGDRRKQTDRHS